MLFKKENLRFNEITISLWLEAIKTELKRSSKSGFNRYHKAIVYETALDMETREAILDKAFPV